MPNEYVDWNLINNPEATITNEQLIKDYPSSVRKTQTNDVTIMKGTAFNDYLFTYVLREGVVSSSGKTENKYACIHRSPAIVYSGQVRVVLQLDLK